MAHKKAFACKLLTFTLLFAVMFMCIRPVPAYASVISDYILYGAASVDIDAPYEERTNYIDAIYTYTGLEAGKWYECTIGYKFVYWDATYLSYIRVGDCSVATSFGDYYQFYDHNVVYSGSSSGSVPDYYSFCFFARDSEVDFCLRARFTACKYRLNSTAADTRWWLYLYLNSVSVVPMENPPSSGSATYDDVQNIVASSTEAINSKLDEKSNEINSTLIEQTELQKEQNETQKGILSKITEFFNGFFDNLISSVVSLVIPSSDDLFAFLEEVNDWFGDRLGFIWYPFSLMFDLVAALGSGTADQYLVIPAISLNLLGAQYTILEETRVDIDAFGFFQYVRFFTSVMMVSGVVKLAVNKWDSWIGGRDAS